MRALTTLVNMLFRSWHRSWTAVFFGILFPVMLLLVFGSIFGAPSTPNYSLYVRNLDINEHGKASQLSAAFVEILNNSVFEVILLSPDETPRQTAFAPLRILTIPKGFTSQLINRTIQTRIDIMIDTSLRFVEMSGGEIGPEERENITRGLSRLRAFRESIAAENVKLVLEGSPDDPTLQPLAGVIHTLASRFEMALLNATNSIDLETVTTVKRQLRAVDYYLPGYIAAFVMTNGVIGVSGVVSDFRRRGLVKLLATTPLSKTTWITALIISQTLVSMILLTVMLAMGWIVFRISALPDLYSLIIILVGTVSYTSLGVLIGSVLKEPGAVSALSNAVAFPLMFLSGAFWPLEIMPELMQQIARLTPLYYFHTALRQTLIAGLPSEAIIPSAVMATMTVVVFSLAYYISKWKDF
ncbi:MAG: ABC transporter permease [Nitrososphaerota archaeon]|nr:ABC transporter permease [Candidatus Calditenuaceae archaeon]MDW8073774.1 ABC transporter permease [Nitrososphaerota archaeon]